MRDNVFAYLDAMMRSRLINMLGAAPHIRREFNISLQESKEYLEQWIKIKHGVT